MIVTSGARPSKVDEGQRMVKVRHRSRRTSRDGPIESVPFANRQHPGLGLEIVSLAELRGRVPMHHRHLYTRPVFHQLILTEAGVVEHEVDFEHYRCGAGTVLHQRPGQVQKFGRETDAQGWVVLYLPEFLPPEPLLETRLGPPIRWRLPRQRGSYAASRVHCTRSFRPMKRPTARTVRCTRFSICCWHSYSM